MPAPTVGAAASAASAASAAAATYTTTDLLHAYRRLYRSALRAVQYSKPARYVVRDQLRAAFRGQRTLLTAWGPDAGVDQTFDPRAVRRTVYFLNAAAAYRGIEHRIVRNLVRTAYWRRQRSERRQPSWTAVQASKRPPLDDEIYRTAYDHYDRTIQQLNKSMGLCLR